MRYNTYFYATFMLTVLLQACTVNSQNLEKFKDKLKHFQYSIYVDLYGLEYDALKNDSLFIKNGIDKKIASFLDQHKEEIKAYKQQTLSKYQINNNKTLPNLDAYQLDSNHDDISIYEEHQWGKEFWNYNKIELFDFIGAITMMLQTQHLKSSEVAEISYKNIFARPLIRTQEVKTNQWKIWIDKYEYIFELEYDLDKDYFAYCKIYSRKP